MQDLNELCTELMRDILDQAQDIEAGAAQPQFVVDSPLSLMAGCDGLNYFMTTALTQES